MLIVCSNAVIKIPEALHDSMQCAGAWEICLSVMGRHEQHIPVPNNNNLELVGVTSSHVALKILMHMPYVALHFSDLLMAMPQTCSSM